MRRIQPDHSDSPQRSTTTSILVSFKGICRILDEHPEAAKWVHDDLVRNQDRHISARCGREGMSGEQVLRVILVKQFGGFSYDELAERYAREPKQACFDGGIFASSERRHVAE